MAEDHSLRLSILAEALRGLSSLLSEHRDMVAPAPVGSLVYILADEVENILRVVYPDP